ncbi:MAG: right-handed parallel beta-helix repeat-containing protein [Asgard group archaeon]|nr:right-handed parallel beta-helix repeat-containing protein [Asgard group archaeon]
MTWQAKKSIIIVIVIVHCIAAGVIPYLGWRYQPLSVHKEISITEDIHFKRKYHCPGEGTISNPYIIANTESSTNISIRNIKSSFIIRNCKANKIEIENIHNNFIIDNSIVNKIIIEETYRYAKIINNTTCLILDIRDSDDFIIINNNLSRIFISNGENWEIKNNIIKNNLNDFPIFYCSGINSFEISKNSIFNCKNGIYMEIGNEIEFFNNTITNCSFLACEFFYVLNLEFSGNKIINNFLGVYFNYGYDVIVAYNNFMNNSKYALFDYSQGIIVYYNNFIDNNLDGSHYLSPYLFNGYYLGFSQAYGYHYFYNPAANIGNYWSDWSDPDGTYLIDPANYTDPYILTEPIDFS